MSRISLAVCFALVLATAAPAAAAAGPFTLEGQILRVKTDRYEMTFEYGALTSLRNLLTGETYARRSAELEQRLPTMLHGLSVYPLDGDAQIKQQIDSTHPWLGSYSTGTQWSYVHHPTSASSVTLRQITANHVVATWKGLRAFNPDRDLPEETFSLDLEMLPGSGDLAVKALGSGAGKGTLGVGFLMANFSRDLDFIWPICEGSHHRPKDLEWQILSAKWPAPWIASLIIAQGERGSVGLWMADPRFRPRYLHLRNNPDSFDVLFESHNEAPFDQWTSAESRPIRINVYRGSWVLPAKAFRNWWATTFKVQPLEKRQPAWLKNIRWAVSWPFPPPAEFGPRTIFLAPQIWKVQPKAGPGVDSGLFPEDIEKGPELSDQMKNVLPKLQEVGSHPIVYLNIHLMNKNHPWAPRYWPYRIIPAINPDWMAGTIKDPPGPDAAGAFAVNCAAKPWQDLIVDWAKQTYERFGITGFYMDCAAGEPNGAFGMIDGKSDCEGQVELMRRIKQAVPGAFLDCEYLNEANATVVDFGSVGFDSFWPGSALARQRHVHPIVGCLFNDFVYTAFINSTELAAFDEVIGRLTRWTAEPPLPPDSITDYSLSQHFCTYRAHLWCRTGMKPIYPDDWDPQVKAYYRDEAGNEYRVLGETADEGRFVKITPAGPELVYWRIKGRNTAELTPDTGLEGWVAYRGATALGLDPENSYFYVAAPRITDWEVRALPEQTIIERSRPYPDGTLVLDLKSADGQPHQGEVEIITRHELKSAFAAGAQVPLTALSRDEQGRIRYRLTAETPGVIAVSPLEPRALPAPDAEGLILRLGADPVAHFAYLTREGLREPIPAGRQVRNDPGRNVIQIMPHWQHEGVMDWLFALPQVPEGKKLMLRFSSRFGHPGNTANLIVRVNGREILRDKLQGKENEPQTHAADLTPWAGQSVLLSVHLADCYLFHFIFLDDPRLVVE